MRTAMRFLLAIAATLSIASTSCDASGIDGEYLRTPEKAASAVGKMDVLRIRGGRMSWGYYNPHYKNGAFDEELAYGIGRFDRTGERFTLSVENDVVVLTGSVIETDGKRSLRFEVGSRPAATSSYTYDLLAKAFGTDPWVEVD